MPGHFQPYGNHGVLVLRQDSWRERPRSTCTRLGLKVLSIVLQFRITFNVVCNIVPKFLSTIFDYATSDEFGELKFSSF
jgi:hypothetical protein